MSTDLSLPDSLTEMFVARLGAIDPARMAPAGPVHVVYGGAHLFKATTIAKLGERARGALESWCGDASTFGASIGVANATHAQEVLDRVREKLARRPVEAMCIDFEDGYGPRPDDVEDADAIRAAGELGLTAAPETTIGIRIKALSGGTVRRAIRTLDLFVSTFARATSGALRNGFSVTLPKVSAPDQVSALVELLEQLESSLGIAQPIGIELMIETPDALSSVRALLDAAKGRANVVHLGAYDLTAELGVTAGDQRLDHPFCDLARMMLQLSVSGRTTSVSDGATTTLPIPPKGANADESATAVRRAWALHAANVRRAIDVGIYQGWDLHPAQLPARYGALFAFFLERKTAMTARLRSFIDNATQASRVGQVFDDAATGHGLIAFFARGIACGALDAGDLTATTLTVSDLSRSFADIVAERSTP